MKIHSELLQFSPSEKSAQNRLGIGLIAVNGSSYLVCIIYSLAQKFGHDNGRQKTASDHSCLKYILYRFELVCFPTI